MKRATTLILAAVCLLTLLGCSAPGASDQDSVTFYYVRKQYQFSSEENVIAAEARTFSGSRKDLAYLMSLYMMGPLDETLSSPFPSGTTVKELKQEGTILMLSLSGLDETVSDSKFSLACACVALTLFELTDCQQVDINGGDRSLLLSREDILLTDTITSTIGISEETQ